jgi:hypothetical protein
MYFRGLGDLSDVATVTDDQGHVSYAEWVAAVKRSGGTVSVAPHLRSEPVADPMSGELIGGGETIPAARYPAALVFPNMPATTLAPGFTHLPDDWSDDGSYVFYLSPPAVQAYTDPTTGEIKRPQNVPGEAPPPKPAWYDDLLKYAKWAGLGLAVIVGLNVVSAVTSIVPRRRD